MKIDDDHFNILIVIDNKNDTINNWFKLLKDNGIDNHLELNTPIQITSHRGFHYTYKVHHKYHDKIRNQTGMSLQRDQVR